MTHVTCRLTAKNRDQLQNPTLGNRVWATFTYLVVWLEWNGACVSWACRSVVVVVVECWCLRASLPRTTREVQSVSLSRSSTTAACASPRTHCTAARHNMHTQSTRTNNSRKVTTQRNIKILLQSIKVNIDILSYYYKVVSGCKL